MKSFLSKEEWEDKAQHLSLGEKIRTNHISDECQGHSKSMIIERKQNGDLVAHCFRCGKSGCIRQAFSRALSEQQNNQRFVDNSSGSSTDGLSNNATSDADRIRAGGIQNVNDWPLIARVWIRKYGITDEECRRNNIFFSPEINRIVMMQLDANNEVISYQTRKVYEWDNQPKYLSYVFVPNIVHHKDCESNVLVLVEDLLSSIKVGRYAHSIPLFSTNLNTNTLLYISKQGYDKIIIWLDNDSPQVILNGQRIARQIEKLGITTKSITNIVGSPKDYPTSRILDTLKNT